MPNISLFRGVDASASALGGASKLTRSSRGEALHASTGCGGSVASGEIFHSSPAPVGPVPQSGEPPCSVTASAPSGDTAWSMMIR